MSKLAKEDMPKYRQEVSEEQLEAVVADLSVQLGDERPEKSSQGFANAVFIGGQYVYKLVPLGADGSLEHPKEREVLGFVTARLPSTAKHLAPTHVRSSPLIEGLGVVDVYSRLPGQGIDQLTPSLAEELGNFLRDLHGCASHQFIHEFEGETDGPTFTDYVSRSVDKFVGKLRGAVSDSSLVDLAERAGSRSRLMAEEVSEPELVTLHKDLFGDNVLAQDGQLTGVIDWEAAQAGPREWEFAILRQRFPETWRTVYGAYGNQLNQRMMDLCGLVQSLRFWKSFPHQDSFVKQQVDYIRAILGE